jgi:hypothetical protein
VRAGVHDHECLGWLRELLLQVQAAILGQSRLGSCARELRAVCVQSQAARRSPSLAIPFLQDGGCPNHHLCDIHLTIYSEGGPHVLPFHEYAFTCLLCCQIRHRFFSQACFSVVPGICFNLVSADDASDLLCPAGAKIPVLSHAREIWVSQILG